MTSRDFAYWLQGFFEISEPNTISNREVDLIRKHLNMVFVHEIDPSFGGEEVQAKLNNIHNVPKLPKNEAEAIEYFGPRPSPNHLYNIHGWYNPAEGTPRC